MVDSSVEMSWIHWNLGHTRTSASQPSATFSVGNVPYFLFDQPPSSLSSPREWDLLLNTLQGRSYATTQVAGWYYYSTAYLSLAGLYSTQKLHIDFCVRSTNINGHDRSESSKSLSTWKRYRKCANVCKFLHTLARACRTETGVQIARDSIEVCYCNRMKKAFGNLWIQVFRTTDNSITAVHTYSSLFWWFVMDTDMCVLLVHPSLL